MKKPKKHLKNLSRLSAYLKKESVRIEKIIARQSEAERSSLLDGVMRRLASRRDVAMADLGLVDAALEAAYQARKAAEADQKAAKKAGRKTAKKAPPKAKGASQKKAKAPAKSASKKTAQSSAKSAPKSARKTAAKKPAVARRRRPKAAAPTEA